MQCMTSDSNPATLSSRNVRSPTAAVLLASTRRRDPRHRRTRVRFGVTLGFVTQDRENDFRQSLTDQTDDGSSSPYLRASINGFELPSYPLGVNSVCHPVEQTFQCVFWMLSVYCESS